jgi:spore maturation protein CgeB
VLFVGSTRGQVRPIVRDAVEAGIPLSVYGVGWDGLLPEGSLRGDFMPNEQLPGAYASAGAVLNDHWPEMAAEGFLSNRLFDAVAAGANVISDDAVGLSEVFGESVRTYRTPADLVELLSSAPKAEARRRAAERIAAEHSFDARARVLVQRAEELRR